jgi:hypothetical protein
MPMCTAATDIKRLYCEYCGKAFELDSNPHCQFPLISHIRRERIVMVQGICLEILMDLHVKGPTK